MRAPAICIVVLGQVLVANAAFAQQPDADANAATAFCDFDDNQEISVRYNNVVSSKDEPRNGKVWLPGGKPLTLFAGAPVSFNNTPIPVGRVQHFHHPQQERVDTDREQERHPRCGVRSDAGRGPRADGTGRGGFAPGAVASFLCPCRSQTVQHPFVLRQGRERSRSSGEVGVLSPSGSVLVR